jgi:calcineurin-like phosphoesterase family protein
MIWFTADLHFNHRNIIKYCNRPFAPEHEYCGEVSLDSVRKMNDTLVANWNSTVKPNDTVYILGDFSLDKNAIRDILPRLNGIKHLIAGNHDCCHPVAYKKEEKRAAAYKLYLDNGISSIKLVDNIIIGNETVVLHHMPYAGEEKNERYANHRPVDSGRWLLHGHVHTMWRTKGKQINVGVDVWDYKPVSIDQIKEIISREKL